VLLAEDETLVRTMIASTLQDQGYTVLQAANGAEALRLAQEHAGKEIHLLLTDVVMPQMGSVELANQLSAIRPETRVLFTSGHPDQLLVHQRTSGSNTQFIQKPFAPAALSRKVREVLEKQMGTS
jgi:two-component system, cell cycle sensor histidine kinase and response regulator CckA